MPSFTPCRSVFLLSADQPCAERVGQVSRTAGGPAVLCFSGPTELLRALRTSAQDGTQQADHVVGLVLDLRFSQPHVSRDDEDAALIWWLMTLAAVWERFPTLPLLLITAHRRSAVPPALARTRLAECVSMDDNHMVWQQAWMRLFGDEPRGERWSSSPNGQDAEPSAIREKSALRLRADLWLALESGSLRRDQEIIALTRRETALLAILARSPGHYVRASDLAHQLTSPDGFPLDDHGIEQIVSQLRRKLGEPPKHPRLLRNRPGFGYALCLEE